eukprot:4266066-Pleurochrysis_carterae.AAC.1
MVVYSTRNPSRLCARACMHTYATLRCGCEAPARPQAARRIWSYILNSFVLAIKREKSQLSPSVTTALSSHQPPGVFSTSSPFTNANDIYK